jgi:hypothetical protein
VSGPVIDPRKDADGTSYVQITMNYAAPLNFIFYKTNPIRLSQTRRVYTQPSS